MLCLQPALSFVSKSSYRYHQSSDGAEVHGPTQEANSTYGKVTANCRDGTHSYSHHICTYMTLVLVVQFSEPTVVIRLANATSFPYPEVVVWAVRA